MEELQIFWERISHRNRIEIKKLLYTDYDFSKRNIDREIAKNIKKIYELINAQKKLDN